MSSLSIYLVGVLVVTGGLAMVMHLAGVPMAWIGAVGVIGLGIGILTAVSKTRTRDHSPM